MKALTIAIVAAMVLAGCGTTKGDRGLSGAGIGAGIGIIGGPPGIVVGGAVGAVVGMATTPSQINLGRPAWRG
jgi:osmotically inducible lipoprotein OsmB